jgi:hypothetical protein
MELSENQQHVENDYTIYFKIFNSPIIEGLREYYYKLGLTVDAKYDSIKTISDSLNFNEPFKVEYYIDVLKGYRDKNKKDISNLVKEVASMYAIIEYQRNIHNPYLIDNEKDVIRWFYSGYNRMYLKMSIRYKYAKYF